MAGTLQATRISHLGAASTRHCGQCYGNASNPQYHVYACFSSMSFQHSKPTRCRTHLLNDEVAGCGLNWRARAHAHRELVQRTAQLPQRWELVQQHVRHAPPRHAQQRLAPVCAYQGAAAAARVDHQVQQRQPHLAQRAQHEGCIWSGVGRLSRVCPLCELGNVRVAGFYLTTGNYIKSMCRFIIAMVYWKLFNIVVRTWASC